MPNAYKLLVGLTAIDPKASYYRTELPGFDGKAGCEGCGRDVELMLGLTHYLGYEGATPKPLINEQATRANVLTALTMLGDPGVLKAGDIVFLYFSCHGRTYGEGPTVRQSAMIGNAVNAVMLWNGPLYNFEIHERILRLPAGVRIFSMFDCCHAGIGSNLDVTGSVFATEALRVTERQLAEVAVRLGLVADFEQVFGVAPAVVLQSISPGQVPSGTGNPRPARLDPRNISKFQELAAAKNGMSLVHFGAARDALTALGDPKGSLFSRLFYRLIAEAVDTMNYVDFFKDLRERLPARHQPVFETVPSLKPGSNGFDVILPPAGHFSSTQSVLQI